MMLPLAFDLQSRVTRNDICREEGHLSLLGNSFITFISKPENVLKYLLPSGNLNTSHMGERMTDLGH